MTGTHFGRYLDSYDINGDGSTELVVSQKSYDSDETAGMVDEGKVIWIEGSRTPDFSDLALESRYWTGELEDEIYGIWAGDMDGDSVPDLMLASRSKNSNAGEVYLVSSQADAGLATTQATWTWAVPDSNIRLGSSLLRVGDVDADGLDDVLVGATHLSTNGSNRGGVFLLRGSDVGGSSDLSTNAVLHGPTNGDQLGYRLERAGDVDGDGQLDVLSTAYYADKYETSAGLVVLSGRRPAHRGNDRR